MQAFKFTLARGKKIMYVKEMARIGPLTSNPKKTDLGKYNVTLTWGIWGPKKKGATNRITT